jgi:hypothetical protein
MKSYRKDVVQWLKRKNDEAADNYWPDGFDCSNYDCSIYDCLNYSCSNYDCSNYDCSNYDCSNYDCSSSRNLNCELCLVMLFYFALKSILVT